jgi:hypothetical protein
MQSSFFPLRRTSAGLLLAFHVIATTGCTSWQTQVGGAATVLAASPQLQRADTSVSVGGPYGQPDTTVSTGSMRVRTASGWIELQNSRVANDSLYGRVRDNPSEVGIPLAAITEVQIRKGSTGRTVALVGGIAVIGLFAAAWVAYVNSMNDLVLFPEGF